MSEALSEPYQDPARHPTTASLARAPIAIVGLSANPLRPSHFVGFYLLRHGLSRDTRESARTRSARPAQRRNLAQIDVPVDIVDVFREPSVVPQIATEAAAIGAKALWLQFGVIHEAGAAQARAAGLDVVMDLCLKIEHARYLGRMHWLGFNTGVISARRRPSRADAAKRLRGVAARPHPGTPRDRPMRCGSAVAGELHILDRLDDDELARLRELTTLFLHQKNIRWRARTGGRRLHAHHVAAQACLPILNLGLDYYRGWYTIILYPGAFVAHREVHDEGGVVHTGYEELDGESAEGGPGRAVVGRSAAATGRRGVQRGGARVRAQTRRIRPARRTACRRCIADMSVAAWSTVMTTAFDAFNAMLDRNEEPPFDDYAGTDPAEFFAVFSELFFTAPDVLH